MSAIVMKIIIVAALTRTTLTNLLINLMKKTALLKIKSTKKVSVYVIQMPIVHVNKYR